MAEVTTITRESGYKLSDVPNLEGYIAQSGRGYLPPPQPPQSYPAIRTYYDEGMREVAFEFDSGFAGQYLGQIKRVIRRNIDNTGPVMKVVFDYGAKGLRYMHPSDVWALRDPKAGQYAPQTEDKNKAQALLDEVVATDVDTYHTLVIARELYTGLRAKGLATAQDDAELRAIEESYQARQAKLKEPGILVEYAQGIVEGFENVTDTISSWWRGLFGPRMGAVTIVIPIWAAVAAVALVGLTVLFTALLSSAKADLQKANRKADDFRAKLPKEQQQEFDAVVEEYKVAADNAAKEASGGLFGGLTKSLGSALMWGGLAFVAVNYFNKKK